MDERQLEIATRIASAKRPSAKMITQIKDGRFVDSWIPRLSGLNVSHPSGKWKYKTREEAISAARDTLENAKKITIPQPSNNEAVNE